MAEADVRWLQRLDNYGRALEVLQRAVGTARQRPLSELEEQGLIQAFEFTHELSWLLLKDSWLPRGSAASVALGTPCAKPWSASC